jgi:reductive dehalogenase
MKGLGLAGAGLGAAAATSPVFHDLDEVLSAESGVWKRAWYIKDRDTHDPTAETDWDIMTRADQKARMYALTPDGDIRFGYRYGLLSRRGEGNTSTKLVNALAQKYNPDWTGDDQRAEALASSVGYGRISRSEETFDAPEAEAGELVNMPKWKGTPEENYRLLRTAFRFFGVSDVGVAPVDSKTKKLIFTRARPGWEEYVFEDIDQAYRTDTKLAIPNKCDRMIVWTVLQPYEATVRFGRLSSASASRAYQQISVIEGQMQNFLWYLGYNGLQGGTGAIGPSCGWGTMGGVGEMTRSYYVITSPEHGNTIRGMNRMLTDMPLPLTPPIDAGIRRFCYDCMKCADYCPSNALSFEREPTWDAPTAPWREWDDSEVQDVDQANEMREEYKKWSWNLRGVKGWWSDVPNCVMCRNCMGGCVFSKLDDASTVSSVTWMISSAMEINHPKNSGILTYLHMA